MNYGVEAMDASFVLQSRHEQIVHHLGVTIVRNAAIKPDQTLPSEPELCARLNVSRNMLREAIKVLAAKGLVESRPKVGTQVRPRQAWNLLDPEVLAWHSEVGPDEWFLRNLSEVRLLVEPQVARLAATRATDEEIASLDAWCRRMRIAVHDPDTFVTADIKFHATLLSASHNELLEQLIAAISAALRASINITAQVAGASEASLPLHAAVVNSIRAHDGQAAEAAMRTLIGTTASDIERGLELDTDRARLEETP